MEHDVEQARYENKSNVLDVLIDQSIGLLILESHCEGNHFQVVWGEV